MDSTEKIKNIVKDLKNQPNKELEFVLEFLTSDFTQTKAALIELTKRLDVVELTYNKVLEEYERRKNVTTK
jgi:exonuclease VII small subunit